MRCVTFVISFILLLVFGCTKKEDKVIYINNCFNLKGEKLNDKDTVMMKKIGDSTYRVELFIHGTRKLFNAELRQKYVKIHSKNLSAKLYNYKKDSICSNIFNEKLSSPYFAGDTWFAENKIYQINNKTYVVSLFKTNYYSTINDFVFYNSEFGFIIYKDELFCYRRIVDIINVPENKIDVLNKLINRVVQDSSFFPYPYFPKPGSMKFSNPKRE